MQLKHCCDVTRTLQICAGLSYVHLKQKDMLYTHIKLYYGSVNSIKSLQ